MADDEEKMRRRRERAAAWALKGGGGSVVEKADNDAAVRQMHDVVGGLAAAEGAKKEFVKATGVEEEESEVKGDGAGGGPVDEGRREPRGWMEWAQQASGEKSGASGAGKSQGWKSTVGGLGSLSEKYGNNNTVASLMVRKSHILLQSFGGNWLVERAPV